MLCMVVHYIIQHGLIHNFVDAFFITPILILLLIIWVVSIGKVYGIGGNYFETKSTFIKKERVSREKMGIVTHIHVLKKGNNS